MKKYTLLDDLKVFGVQVKTFPAGIGEAFDELAKTLPKDGQRSFYGITEASKDGVIYRAMALETFDGEADRYGYETYTIPKGEYFIESIRNWASKTHTINDVFQSMFKSAEEGKCSGPCVEWYKDDNEMLCMVKIKETSY